MEDKDFQKYEIEYVNDDNIVVDRTATNAMGYPKQWYTSNIQNEEKLAEPVEEEPQMGQITLEEIEAIRKEAYEDGFNEGKQEGIKQGQEIGYQEGFQKGENEGFADGQAKGLSSGTEIITEQAARFCRFANHLVKPIGDFDKEISSELIYLASRLARTFIKDELSRSTTYLEKTIAEAFRLLPMASSDVTLQLNQRDYDLVKNSVSLQNINLQVNPELKPGDIKVFSAMSSIDVRQEERIDNYLKEFLTLNNDKNIVAEKDNGFEVEHCYDSTISHLDEQETMIGASDTSNPPNSKNNNVTQNQGVVTNNQQGIKAQGGVTNNPNNQASSLTQVSSINSSNSGIQRAENAGISPSNKSGISMNPKE